MYTFQDFELDLKQGTPTAVQRAISQHRGSEAYITAVTADKYDRQQNTTILAFVRWLYTDQGRMIADPTASNNKICSNYFRRLNTQRCTYSLGNGVVFEAESTKDALGQDFDTRLKSAGYKALIHGVSFIFWNVDRIHVFPLTEFAPLWDEETGALRAGIRFWQVDSKKPTMAVLYEEDGFTKLRGNATASNFEVVEQKRPYRIRYVQAPIDDEPEIIGEDNYGTLPIVPLYGSELIQSTLVGMQAYIDGIDLAMSGFANDLQDCAEIYWLVNGAGGMSDSDLSKFRDRLKFRHIAGITDEDGATITPYTQEIPTVARETFLKEMHDAMYESFGALDVHAVSAGSTNDHLEAAYQPLDENADDFEYQIIDTVQTILREFLDIEDTPIFKRNRISNLKEQTDMVLASAQFLDDYTILTKLPFITPDEVKSILEDRAEEEYEAMKEKVKAEKEVKEKTPGTEDDVNVETESEETEG